PIAPSGIRSLLAFWLGGASPGASTDEGGGTWHGPWADNAPERAATIARSRLSNAIRDQLAADAQREATRLAVDQAVHAAQSGMDVQAFADQAARIVTADVARRVEADAESRRRAD